MVFLIWLGCLGGESGFLAQFAAFSGAALQLGESTSIAAGQAINLTGVMAASATDVVSAVTSNGLNAAANAWHGVDILDLQAQRCAALLTLDGVEVLHEWFRSPASAQLVSCLNQNLQDQLVATAESVTLGMPAVQFADEVLKLDHSFESVKVWGQLIPSGKLQLTFEVIHLTYHLAWSNPIWDQLRLDVHMERSQILQSLRRTLRELPHPMVSPQPPALELQVAFSWPMIKARLRSHMRRLLLEISQKCWFWAVETFRGEGAVNESFVFVMILVPTLLPILWLLVHFWLARFSLPPSDVGQCYCYSANDGILALQDAEIDPIAVTRKEGSPLKQTEKSGEADLSGISEHTESSEGKNSFNSVGSFQLVSAIPISSDEECSSICSVKSELFQVGASGS